MKDIAIIIKGHFKYIMNYFIHRTIKTRAEGINSKIAVIEKRG